MADSAPGSSVPPELPVHEEILDWYADGARTLPWRAPGVGPWQVMVSEVMLQQTPVSRVLPAYDAWIARWPTPSALAAEPSGEAIRMWGRLGYPRRALRLHAAATVMETHYDGQVPATYDALRALPGIGDYTAAAVCAFAYRHRTVVLDTNVRRVLSRVWEGIAHPATHVTAAERDRAANMLPEDPEQAARWSVAVMELGALVCTARAPACHRCPVAHACTWHRAGNPPHPGPPRRGQTYAGTDRQCRGRILALLRDSHAPVPLPAVDEVWGDVDQRQRALTTLIDDGLVVETGAGALTLP
ncbi:MAG: A/G-specific adenine glycosylase [Nocardioidaceae bacterium]